MREGRTHSSHSREDILGSHFRGLPMFFSSSLQSQSDPRCLFFLFPLLDNSPNAAWLLHAVDRARDPLSLQDLQHFKRLC